MIVGDGNYQDLLDSADVAECMPNLIGKYRKTSEATINYNCLAWAVGVTWAWFEPSTQTPGYYWPPGIEMEWTLPVIRKLLGVFGYREEANDSELEAGSLKIAIYTDSSGIPTHFARQLPNGNWTSKLGDLIDIEHETLECMEGDEPYYGKVEVLLKRPFTISQ